MEHTKKHSLAVEDKEQQGVFHSSTIDFVREARNVGDYSFWDLLHGLIYGRWPYFYIGIGKGNHPITKRFAPIIKFWRVLFPADQETRSKHHNIDHASGTIADGYHGKVMLLETARELVMINEPIRMPDLEQVIPYVRARAIILENPDQIVVLECPCRSAKENPCLPLDVCMVIGEPFASYVIDHHPEKARWITQQQAVEILEETDARGNVHHAFFKDAMLGRYYAICNCCSCCCGAMGAHQSGVPMLASSGYVAYIDPVECISCDTCSEYCQFDALGIVGDSGLVSIELCMGCGVCVTKCPQDAISMRRDETKGIPLEIQTMMDNANVSPRSG
ncbi:ATP-binding protein [Chloroflexota bacterium]